MKLAIVSLIVLLCSCASVTTMQKEERAWSLQADGHWEVVPVKTTEQRTSGVLHGRVSAVYENGKPYYVKHYRNGKLHGRCEFFDPTGVKILSQTWTDDLLDTSHEMQDGKWIQTCKGGTGTYSYFTCNGVLQGWAEYQNGEYVRGAHQCDEVGDYFRNLQGEVSEWMFGAARWSDWNGGVFGSKSEMHVSVYGAEPDTGKSGVI